LSEEALDTRLTVYSQKPEPLNQELAIQNYHIHEGDKWAWRGRLVNSIDASGLRPHHIIWKALDLIMWSQIALSCSL